jgi:hypothetical protein
MVPPVIGDWQDHWRQLHELAQRIAEIRDGRPGGSDGASADMRSFFERSESLRDWVKREIGDTGKTSRVDAAMKMHLALQLAHDIAIKNKHKVQNSQPWSGATDTDVVSQSVTIRVGANASHEWAVSYTPPGSPQPVQIDLVALSRDVLTAWQAVLAVIGLTT